MRDKFGRSFEAVESQRVEMSALWRVGNGSGRQACGKWGDVAAKPGQITKYASPFVLGVAF